MSLSMENGSSAPPTAPKASLHVTLETLDRLVALTSRMFYSPKYTIVLDALSKFQTIRDDDLCNYLKIPTLKDLNKISEKLRKDGLIRIENKVDVKTFSGKAIQSTIYSMDYVHFINVVKYRMFCIQKRITESASNDLSSQGYVCSSCNKEFDAIDAPRLLFSCDECANPITKRNKEDAEQAAAASSEAHKHQHKLQRLFNDQTRTLRELLKKTEELDVKICYPNRMKISAEAIRRNVDLKLGRQPLPEDQSLADGSLQSKSNAQSTIRDISDVGEDANRSVINVEIKKDVFEMQREREMENQRKRMENQRPDWFTHSTVNNQKFVSTNESGSVSPTSLMAAAQRLSGNVPGSALNTTGMNYAQFYNGLRGSSSSAPAADISPAPKRFKSEDSTEVPKEANPPNVALDVKEEDFEEEDNDEEIIVKAGDLEISIFDVTEDHIKQMTPEQLRIYNSLKP